MHKLTRRKWKAGAVIAVITGLLMAVSTAAGIPGITLKAFLWVLGLNVARELIPYFKKHPLEEVEDTVIIHKSRKKDGGTTPH